MNYFYGITNNIIKCQLTIPCFQNKGKRDDSYSLFEFKIINNKWQIIDLNHLKINKNFYRVNNELIKKNNFFCLLKKDNYKKIKILPKIELKNFNNFTDTDPAFRSNLKIYIEGGGHSSYQSEYPYAMTANRGSLLSPISTLLYKEADKNFIFLKNIMKVPSITQHKVFLVNISSKKIINEFFVHTNSINEIPIDKSYIKPEIYLCSKDIFFVPMFVSIKNDYLSIEHTHPPHDYVPGVNSKKKVSLLKDKVYEIIT